MNLGRRILNFIYVFVYGAGIEDKFALFLLRVIYFFSYRVLKQRKPGPRQKVIIQKLIKNRIVNINNIKYFLVDYESLFVVFPEFEQEIWNYLKPKRGEVFIDVGAHIGKYALQIARMVGDEGLVIAIEPNPDNYQHLTRAIQLNNFKNIVPLNLAAWSQNCKLKLFLGDLSAYHTAKKDTGFGYLGVEARTVDSIIERLNLKRVDWIKIDVEGAELEVLKGLKKTLADMSPRVIVETFRNNLKDVKSLLEKHDYIITPIEGLSFKGLSFIGDYFNYLYCEPQTK